MATTSSYASLPIPQSTDTDQVWVMMAAFAAAIEPWLIRSFASAAERTTYLTAAGLGTGIRGMVTYNQATGRHEQFSGTAWLPLVPVTQVTNGIAIKGTTYDGVSPIITQRFSAVVTTNGSGAFNANFVSPFPNGLFSVEMTMGDATAVATSVVAYPVNHTLSTCQGLVYSGTGLVLSQAVRLEVDAVGW